MQKNNIEHATKNLIDFMHAMKYWEEKYYILFQQDNVMSHVQQARLDLLIIYNKYLTKKERKTGRLAGLNAGYPSEFDPKHKRIISTELVNPKKIVFKTHWVHPKFSDFKEDHKLTMIKKRNDWLLDKYEIYSTYRNKWINIVF